jgi:hypothetical protein
MRLKQWQPWQGIFNHIVSPHLRKVGVGMPRVSLSSPDGRSVSRRAFMQGAAGVAGLSLAAAHWTPGQAAKPNPGEPLPIPTVRQTPFGPIHENANLDQGLDPSLITDFQGVVGAANLNLTGTGMDTAAVQSAQYDFNIDVRFMQGEFIGADGQHHQGTFAFI